jgi:hypothetical protein
MQTRPGVPPARGGGQRERETASPQRTWPNSGPNSRWLPCSAHCAVSRDRLRYHTAGSTNVFLMMQQYNDTFYKRRDPGQTYVTIMNLCAAGEATSGN